MAELMQMITNDCNGNDTMTHRIAMKKLQANFIVERVHQTTHNMACAFSYKELDKDDPWTGILSATMFCMALGLLPPTICTLVNFLISPFFVSLAAVSMPFLPASTMLRWMSMHTPVFSLITSAPCVDRKQLQRLIRSVRHYKIGPISHRCMTHELTLSKGFSNSIKFFMVDQ